MPVRKKPPTPENPKGSIFLLFHQVRQKMDIEQKNLFLKYDITPRQFIVLQTIDFQPGSNQNEIVNSINIDRSTLSKITEKLESKNYISSQQKEGDKRHKQLRITSKGRSTLRRLQQSVRDLENIFINKIELDTKKKFLSSLRSYVTK
jgi:DNA-binding MarR family transcriptional regulator